MTQLTRRRFIQLTSLLAGAISIPAAASMIPVTSAKTILGDPIDTPIPAPWVPTQAEVDEWLAYYKLTVDKRFHAATDYLLVVPAGDYDTKEIIATVEEIERFQRDFAILEGDRQAVGKTQGDGYAAGRNGMPRAFIDAHGPSNANFGWYNGWALGDYDRRWRAGEVKLARSPGMNWPEGKRPNPFRAPDALS